ncbi:MAG: DUF1684 domain-containing protein [Calditrichaeota bacterium]|nr:MAG: DUF1684 domain-containing protein [Calditrichota bacterium]
MEMKDCPQLLCRIFASVILFLFGILVSNCISEKVSENQNSYFLEISEYRQKKDNFIKTSNRSPLSESDRINFQNLSYFAIDGMYRISVKLRKYAELDTIQMFTSKGTKRRALKYGFFNFTLHGKNHKLVAYKSLKNGSVQNDYLFLPFYDKTNGVETYGGGRFLDLHENKNNEYILDFNLAYNPYCAYGNENYICPKPPEENTIHALIEAGEKKWK